MHFDDQPLAFKRRYRSANRLLGDMQPHSDVLNAGRAGFGQDIQNLACTLAHILGTPYD